MSKAKQPVVKCGHPLRVNTFYAYDRCTSTSKEIDAKIIRVALGDGFGNSFELEHFIDVGNDPTRPGLAIRSNSGRLVIKPEVANRVTIQVED